MVIRVTPSGSVNCEVSSLRIVVDPSSRERGDLTLKTIVDGASIHDEPAGFMVNAGEYEISGIKVTGIDMEGETDKKTVKTTYIVEADEVTMCFLAPITKEPPAALLEKIGEIDILFISCGKGLLSAKNAAALIKEIEPHIVVPRNDETAKDLSSEMGKKAEQSDRLVIKKKDIGEEGTKLVWIKEK